MRLIESGFVGMRGGHVLNLWPSIDLDFSGSFVPTLLSTQERSGPATMWQDDGTLGWGPMNIVLQSTQLQTAPWNGTQTGTGVAPVATGNAGSDPEEGNRACLIALDYGAGGAAGDRSIWRQSNLAVTSGLLFAAGLWVKAKDASNVGKTIRFMCEGLFATHVIITLTSGWQWVEGQGTASAATINILVECRGTYTTRTAEFYAYGAQVNSGVTCQDHLPTTTAARYLLRNELSPFTGRRGLLMEGQRTNLVAYSADLSNLAWTKAGSSVSTDTTLAVDGVSLSYKMVEDANNSQHRCLISVTSAAAAIHTFSAYVKTASGTRNISLYPQGATNGYAVFKLSTKAVVATGGAAYVSSGVIDIGDGVSQVWLSLSIGAGAYNYVIYCSDSTAPAPTYVGDGASATYIWGVQCEQGEMPSHYIPTAGGTASRTTDTCTYILPAALATALSAAGTVLVEFDYTGAGSAAAGSTRGPVSIDDGTNSERIIIYNRAGFAASCYSAHGGGNDYAYNLGATAAAPNVVCRAAGAWGADIEGAYNGVAMTKQAGGLAAPTGLTNMDIGHMSASTQLYGHLYRLRVFDHALSQAELQAVTA